MTGRGKGRAGEGRGKRAAGKKSACGEKDAEGRGNRKNGSRPSARFGQRYLCRRYTEGVIPSNFLKVFTK